MSLGVGSVIFFPFQVVFSVKFCVFPVKNWSKRCFWLWLIVSWLVSLLHGVETKKIAKL